MSKVKVGVLGSGFIAITDYYPAFQREDLRELLEVTAICDTVPGRAAEHCAQFGFGKPYEDYDKMLAEADIDLLMVFTPIPLHYQQVKKALEHGLNVYVQKTMTIHTEEAIELCELAESKGLFLAAAPGQMVMDNHYKPKELLDTGKFGKICYARGLAPHPGYEKQYLFGIDPSWYYKKGGGPMGDCGVYPITSITGLLGPEKRVCGFAEIAIPDRYWNGKKLVVEEADNVHLLLEFDGGAVAEISGNFCSPQFNVGPQVEIFCENGIIRIGGWTMPSMRYEYYCHEPMFGSESGWYRPAPVISDKPFPATWHTIWDVIDCVKHLGLGEPSKMSARHAAHVIEIIEKGYEAAATGKTMDLTTTF